jgi:hypothetical protein
MSYTARRISGIQLNANRKSIDAPRAAVIVHSIDHARAALAVAARLRRPITLYSAEGAAAYAGAGWFRAMLAAAQAEHPAADCEAVLDCGSHAGLALAALRAGCPTIVFHGKQAIRRKIAAIAETRNARLDPGAGDALDLKRCHDPETAVTAWLGQSSRPPSKKAAR